MGRQPPKTAQRDLSKLAFSIDLVRAYHEVAHGITAIEALKVVKYITTRVDLTLHPELRGVRGAAWRTS